MKTKNSICLRFFKSCRRRDSSLVGLFPSGNLPRQLIEIEPAAPEVQYAVILGQFVAECFGQPVNALLGNLLYLDEARRLQHGQVS